MEVLAEDRLYNNAFADARASFGLSNLLGVQTKRELI
jgi:hypothetical protein